MRISVSSILRLALLTATVTTSLALGLASLARIPSPERSARGVEFVGLNSTLFASEPNESTWLDPNTGRVETMRLPEDQELSLASLSPWLDETGSPQAAGRWCRRIGRRADMTKGEFGLARVSFPTGTILQTVESDVLPVGAPCWFPAPVARILFAAGNGNLYTLDFDAKEEDCRPREVRWAIPKPGEGEVHVDDPCWIADEPGVSARLAVSLRSMSRSGGERPRFGKASIWWLRLGADGESIVAAGPMLPTSPDDDDVDQRFPSTRRARGGIVRLGYFRTGGARGGRLMVTELDVPKNGSGPLVARDAGRELTDACLPNPPVFAADGRTVTALKGRLFQRREMVTFSLDPERDGLASAEGGPAAPFGR